jgi:hypothetical protein
MLKKLIVVASAALLVPVAALATPLEVDGPASVSGQGAVRGALHSAEGSATVSFRLRAGMIRVTGSSQDLAVECTGRGLRTGTRQNRRLKIVVCKGRGLVAKVTSSRFRFGALARKYGIQVPDGVSGVLNGSFDDAEAPAPEDAEAARTR